MNVLIVGGGGREHALVWSLAQSRRVRQLYCTPGNPGIAALAQCVDVGYEGVAAIADFAESRHIDLVVVGPEAYLAAGLVDELQRRGIRAFGPTKAAARIETDKAFAKRLMERKGIRTGSYQLFDNAADASDYVRTLTPPIVVKATGLAGGKGVTVAQSQAEAVAAIEAIMNERVFGDAGNEVIVEEYLIGEEASVLAFSDGHRALPMAPAQDHKRAYDGDTGPNTGGMGAYSPVPIVDESMQQRILDEILTPAIEGLREEGTPYIGVLYAGLMIGPDGPAVIEFNARFGDPEAQVVLPRLQTDLVDVMEACIDGHLDQTSISFIDEASLCVILASGGYPGSYQTGKVIEGLDRVAQMDGVTAFHAGTALRDGRLVTDGGRVVAITALGSDIRAAAERAYQAVQAVAFDGMHYRTDIGHRAIERLPR